MAKDDTIYRPAPGEAPPPLYKPELIEQKQRLTLLQHCYKEPWVPIGARRTGGARAQRARTRVPACGPIARVRERTPIATTTCACTRAAFCCAVG